MAALWFRIRMTENFLYFITYQSSVSAWVTMVIVRTLFSAVMHCAATATLGAFLGYAKFKSVYFKNDFPLYRTRLSYVYTLYVELFNNV